MGLAEFSKILARCDIAARRGRKEFALTATIAVTLLACVIPSTLSAQTNVSPSAARAINRYLFIVETSRAMQPRAQGVFDALKRALDSSLNGEIRQGDLVGIWTFNETLFQELFPTQIWSQPTQLAFAVRLAMFADPKLYQRRARLDKVFPEMLKLMAENEYVTIILVTTGEGTMQETPFNSGIDAAWKEWHEEQEGVRMPLQTVIRARNGQPADWFLTPAPRPIDFARLAIATKSRVEKEGKPAEVILESGLITNQPASTGTQQQVAFSVWASGKTGVTTSATSPPIISPQPRMEDSAPPTVASATNTSGSNQPSNPQGEPPKTAAVIPPMEEPNQHSVAAAATAEGHENRISNDDRSLSSNSNTAAESRKPVELVFVTTAPAQPVPVAEAAVKESMPATTPPPASTPSSTAASSVADPPADHLSLLAHARAADPSREETKSTELALAPLPRGFLRDNIKPLALMIVAGLAAVYCFRMWLRTNARPRGVSVSLAQETEEDFSHSEAGESSFVKRR